MKRVTAGAITVVALVLIPLGCGSDDEWLAKVNGERIGHEDVESLIELYKGRAEAREGEAERKGNEEVGHAEEVGALQVLVQREMLEQKARQLGVTVDEDAVEKLAERLEGPESARPKREDEGDEDEEALGEQIRETARAQLLYQALHRRVTRNVRVQRSEVIAYYRSHRSSYRSRGRGLETCLRRASSRRSGAAWRRQRATEPWPGSWLASSGSSRPRSSIATAGRRRTPSAKARNPGARQFSVTYCS